MSLLNRRLKRHVSARRQDFFVAAAPWLTPLCRRETETLTPLQSNIQTVAGGVIFQGHLPDGYQANLQLATANRILMRLMHIKVTNFRMLQRKLAAFPWELYLYRDSQVVCHLSTRQSRLYHRGALQNCFQEAIHNRLIQYGDLAPKAAQEFASQSVFGRITNDLCTVSLDSSGALLHKRGLRSQVGQAPLRETIAAGILQLAEYDPQQPLLNPFCGSGSFLLEASRQSCRIPPGWFRAFAFMGWPSFKPRQWNWLRNQAERCRLDAISSPIIGLDLSNKVIRGLQAIRSNHSFFQQVEVKTADFFSFSPRSLKLAPGLMVLNPPYGRRLDSQAVAFKLFQNICTKLNRDYAGWKYAILTPQHQWLESLRGIQRQYAITHGGLHLLLVIGRIT